MLNLYPLCCRYTVYTHMHAAQVRPVRLSTSTLLRSIFPCTSTSSTWISPVHLLQDLPRALSLPINTRKGISLSLLSPSWEDRVDLSLVGFFFFNKHQCARPYAKFLGNSGGQDRPSSCPHAWISDIIQVITSGMKASKKCGLLRNHTQAELIQTGRTGKLSG